MNVNTDLSFLTLVAQASLVVQAVLLLLAALSLWSWWQIFLKMFQLKRTTRDTDAFENEFWKGGDLNELYQSSSKSRTGSGLELIFTAGFREYAKHRKQGSNAGATMDSARRAMRISSASIARLVWPEPTRRRASVLMGSSRRSEADH